MEIVTKLLPPPAARVAGRLPRSMGVGSSMKPTYELDEDEPPEPSPPVEIFEAGEVEMPSKSAPKRRLAAPKQEEEDDWGNDELDDVLPPM